MFGWFRRKKPAVVTPETVVAAVQANSEEIRRVLHRPTSPIKQAVAYNYDPRPVQVHSDTYVGTGYISSADVTPINLETYLSDWSSSESSSSSSSDFSPDSSSSSPSDFSGGGGDFGGGGSSGDY